MTAMKTLDNKVAIVTGGGTGIGEAICRTFARQGASVVVNGLPDDPIADVVAAILDEGGAAIPFAGDVSDESQAQACVDYDPARVNESQLRSAIEDAGFDAR